MPRRPRRATGGYVFYVLNRAAGRKKIFRNDEDYAAFEQTLEEAREQVPMRLLAYCIMPNHWHLVLWPRRDGELSEYMRWLTNTHTRRWHLAHRTTGTGPLYQGRFKSFPVQQDDHYYRLCRYVERNALRANLTLRAEDWRWSSLHACVYDRTDVTIDIGPLPYGSTWVEYVNQPETEAELAALRNSAQRGSPYGEPTWRKATAAKLKLESKLGNLGRPRKQSRSRAH